MIRKFVCAAVVVCVTFGFALAEEFGASITKVDGDKITFHKTKKGVKGDEEKLTVAKDVKVNKGKTVKGGKTEVGDAIENGLKNEIFTKIGEKGLAARITTSDDGKSITAIVITGGKKAGK